MPGSSKEEMMHFHLITYIAKPQHRNSWPGGHEIDDFGRPVLCNHYYTFSLSEP